MEEDLLIPQNRILLISDDHEDFQVIEPLIHGDYQLIDCLEMGERFPDLKQNQKRVAMVLFNLEVMIQDQEVAIAWMKQNEWLKSIPFILLTGTGDDEEIECGFQYGAFDVIRKPFHKRVVEKRLNSILELFYYKNHLEDMVQKQTYALNEQNIRLKKHNWNMQGILRDIITFRNVESEEHIQSVSKYVGILANTYARLFPNEHMTQQTIDYIVQAAKIHDLGKITMPERIIRRQGSLLPEEIEYLKEHTIKGAKIIEAMLEFQNEQMRSICYNICKYHHERYDGTGYPEQLKYEEIPVEAQLVAAADIYDALVNVNTNKEMIPPRKAMAMMLDGGCGELSPRMKECLMAAFDELCLCDDKV